MGDAEPMTCEACGTAMNLHAEKIDYGESEEGALEESHACPDCGAAASRPSRDG